MKVAKNANTTRALSGAGIEEIECVSNCKA
ncbi:MAG: hypothetical protein RLZZ513_1640 [Pseudomonadota bacterium]|jgi:hypothetical protein